jgi:hypothetical protein
MATLATDKGTAHVTVLHHYCVTGPMRRQIREYAAKPSLLLSAFIPFSVLMNSHECYPSEAIVCPYTPKASITSRATAVPEYCCWPVTRFPSRTACGLKRPETMKFVPLSFFASSSIRNG